MRWDDEWSSSSARRESWLPELPSEVCDAVDTSWQWHLAYHDGGPESCPVCTAAAYETALAGASIAEKLHGSS